MHHVCIFFVLVTCSGILMQYLCGRFDRPQKIHERCHRPIHIGFSTHWMPCAATATDGYKSLWNKRNISGNWNNK